MDGIVIVPGHKLIGNQSLEQRLLKQARQYLDACSNDTINITDVSNTAPTK